MLSLGIQPGDALKLLEYSEVSWFIEEAKRVRKNELNRESQRLAEAFRMAQVSTHKKGFATYVRWFRSLESGVEVSKESQPVKTVFEVIKSREKKGKTLLGKIKGFKRMVNNKG